MADSAARALSLGRGAVVSLVGAGGKTTLAYRLARELCEEGLRVVVTTTTHMGTLPGQTTGPVLVDADGDTVLELPAALREHGRATVLGRRVREDKLEGLSPERVDSLTEYADATLVEADGARGRSLKVPAAHEPVVPASTTRLVVLAGLDALGQPLDDTHVHRVAELAAATGRSPGEVIDAQMLVRALCAPSGYLRYRAPGRRLAVFLNKAESEASFQKAAALAEALLAHYDLVLAGSARAGALSVWR